MKGWRLSRDASRTAVLLAKVTSVRFTAYYGMSLAAGLGAHRLAHRGWLLCFGARISRAVGRHGVTAAVRAGVRVDGNPAAMEVTEGVVLRRRAVLAVTSGPG